MDKYNLDHLIGDDIISKIQDDESLFLYSLVRCNRIKRILELGGGFGSFSAINFLAAQKIFDDAFVYTIDVNPVTKISENHKVVLKDCNEIVPLDIDNKPIDLIFFDCHTIIPQLNLYNRLKDEKLINDDTIIVLHDTNLFYEPFVNQEGVLGYNKNSTPYDVINDGYCHQWVERQMVNYFKLNGYDVFSVKTKKEDHSDDFPIRNGLSICQKFKPMTPFHLVYEK